MINKLFSIRPNQQIFHFKWNQTIKFDGAVSLISDNTAALELLIKYCNILVCHIVKNVLYLHSKEILIIFLQ